MKEFSRLDFNMSFRRMSYIATHPTVSERQNIIILIFGYYTSYVIDIWIKCDITVEFEYQISKVFILILETERNRLFDCGVNLNTDKRAVAGLTGPS